MRTSREKMNQIGGGKRRGHRTKKERQERVGAEKGEERGGGRTKVGGYAPDTSLVRGVGALN